MQTEIAMWQVREKDRIGALWQENPAAGDAFQQVGKADVGGMEMVEYEDSFYDQVLALDGVVQLYKDIDAAVGGLGTILQESLAK